MVSQYTVKRVVSATGRVYSYTYPRINLGRKKTVHHPDFDYKSVAMRGMVPRIRQLCLERDHYQCVHCGSPDNLEIHHKDLCGTSRIAVVDNSLENLLTLCGRCHQLLHIPDRSISCTARNWEIYNLRCVGLTFASIAKQFRITRQRSQQIYKSVCEYLEVRRYRP